MTHMTHSLVPPMRAHIEVIHEMRHKRHTSGNAPDCADSSQEVA
jgi:hypothetical protein